MSELRHVPVLMRGEELCVVLRDIVLAVEAGDSFEGNLSYDMPEYLLAQAEYDRLPKEEQELYEPYTGFSDEPSVSPDYEMKRDAGRSLFAVRGVYRIGNSMGQGGVRMIGRMEPVEPSEPVG